MSIETTCRDPECGEQFDDRHVTCPKCGLTGTEAKAKADKAKGLPHLTLETLEAELKTLSARIASDPIRFQQVRDELKRRHAAGGDQPVPVEMTAEQRRQNEELAFRESNRLLVLKVTEMEAEQAKLVVEAEMHRQQRAEAEERLALVVRRLPTKREPMTREAARELLITHMYKLIGMTRETAEVADFAIDAVVEASR